MKKYMYALSILSCGILTYLLISKGKFLAAALAASVAILYTAGIIIDARRNKRMKAENKENAQSADAGPDDTVAIKELADLLKKYSKNLRIFRNATVSLGLIAVMVVFVNESLAISIAIIALFTLFKLYQNLRAVRLIKKGLAERGLLDKVTSESLKK